MVFKKFLKLDIPYKYYSLSYISIFGILALFGFLLGALIMFIAIIINYSGDKTIFSTIISAFIVLGLIIIWFIGHELFFMEDKLFLHPKEYFMKYEEELGNNITTENFKNYLNVFKEFIVSKNEILIIHSFAGYGKTHLLRQILLSENEFDTQRTFLISKPNFSNSEIDKAFKKELKRNEEYLLVFDNVDLEDIKKILVWAENKDSIKVIFSLRTSYLNYILKKIDFKYIEINIKWHDNDLIHFLREITGYTTIKDKVLVIGYNSPRLIKLKLDAINKPNFSLKDLEMIVKSVDLDVKSCLNNFNYPFIEKEKFLINLSCLFPFPKNDDKIWEILESQTEFEASEMKKMINDLIEGGLLLEVNNSIRFNSDIVGYIYLYYKIRHLENFIPLIENFIDNEYEIGNYFPKNVYKNLGNTISIANLLMQNVTTINIRDIDNLCSNIINQWNDIEEETFGAIRAKNLSYLEFFCQIVPDRTLDLLNAYLKSDPPVSEEFYLNQELKMENFGPIIIRLFEIRSKEKEIIEIIEQTQEKGLKTTYNNYETCDLIKQMVSPFRKLNTKDILKILTILDDDLNISTDTRIKLISCALTEIFTVSKYDHISGLFEFERIKLEVENKQEIINFRNKGLEILKKLINHPSINTKLAGIEIAKNIGLKVSKDDNKLYDQLIKERMQIVEVIGSLVVKDADFRLLTEIEDLFLRWWAIKAKGTEEVEDYLSDSVFPRDIEYIASKNFVSGKYVIEDFEDFKQHAPSEDLWSWFVDQKHDYLLKYYEPTYYEDVVKVLDQEYNDIQKLQSLLKLIDKNITGFEFNYNTPLIACWIQFNQDLFSELRTNDEKWADVPERFKGGIELALSEINEENISKMAEELLSELKDADPIKLSQFLRALGRTTIEKSKIQEWLDQIIKDGSSDQLSLIIYNLSYIYKDDFNSLADTVYSVISKESKLTSGVLINLWLPLSSLNKNIDKISAETVKKLRKDLCEKLVEVEDLDHHCDEILNFVFTNMDRCFEFVEKRINFFNNNQVVYYNPIPFDGMDYIKNNVNSYEDFEKFMEKFTLLNINNPDWDIFLDDLITNIKNKPNLENLYLQKYVEKQIGEVNIDKSIISIKFLPLNNNNYKLFVDLGELSITSGNYKNIKSIITDKTSFNSYLAKAGEIPPVFKEKIGLLEKMRDASKPGKLRSMFDSLIIARKEELIIHQNRIEDSKHSH